MNYCRKCGSKIKQDQKVCMNCGFNPWNGFEYCQNCGAKTSKNQKICVNCGFELLNKPKVDSVKLPDIDTTFLKEFFSFSKPIYFSWFFGSIGFGLGLILFIIELIRDYLIINRFTVDFVTLVFLVALTGIIIFVIFLQNKRGKIKIKENIRNFDITIVISSILGFVCGVLLFFIILFTSYYLSRATSDLVENYNEKKDELAMQKMEELQENQEVENDQESKDSLMDTSANESENIENKYKNKFTLNELDIISGVELYPVTKSDMEYAERMLSSNIERITDYVNGVDNELYLDEFVLNREVIDRINSTKENYERIEYIDIELDEVMMTKGRLEFYIIAYNTMSVVKEDTEKIIGEYNFFVLEDNEMLGYIPEGYYLLEEEVLSIINYVSNNDTNYEYVPLKAVLKYYDEDIDLLSPESLNNAGMEFYYSGYYNHAATLFYEATKLDGQTDNLEKLGLAYYNLACVFSILSEDEQNKYLDYSLKYLERSFQIREDRYERCLEDPDFDNIRNTEEFKKLIQDYSI